MDVQSDKKFIEDNQAIIMTLEGNITNVTNITNDINLYRNISKSFKNSIEEAKKEREAINQGSPDLR